MRCSKQKGQVNNTFCCPYVIWQMVGLKIFLVTWINTKGQNKLLSYFFSFWKSYAIWDLKFYIGNVQSKILRVLLIFVMWNAHVWKVIPTSSSRSVVFRCRIFWANEIWSSINKSNKNRVVFIELRDGRVCRNILSLFSIPATMAPELAEIWTFGDPGTRFKESLPYVLSWYMQKA